MMETVPSGTVLHERYRVERVHGSGGFGHVYLAVDLQTGQNYALKEYLVTGSGGQEHLKHEAAVLSQLHHPNLPAFHDAFIERGRYYVVLSYIEGHDLTDLIRMARQRNSVVPLPQILSWLLAVCDAVRFLHSQHPTVIHRDIKPDNIRITPNGTAILVDLGNAKAAADGARTLFFIRHQGTPGYAPPEQYPGGSGTDIRSDIYALSATLYFALTAHEPPSVSTRNQLIQQGKPDLPSLQEVLASNPPEENQEANAARQFRLGVKPSKPAPRHLRHVAQMGQLPPELLYQINQIIQRAMAMKPRDRYTSVSDFAADLKKVMQALPAQNAQPTNSRPIDPHSTQPDLPMLYDALQAAKEQQAQQNPPVTPQPSKSQPANRTCPRCGASLTVSSAYCPRCGTALKSTQDAPSNSAPASSAPRSGDIAGDQTLLIKRSALQATLAEPQTSHKTGAPLMPPTTPHVGRPPTNPALPVTGPAVPRTPPPSSQQQTFVPARQPSVYLPTSGVRLKILITLLAILLVFLLITAVIISRGLLH